MAEWLHTFSRASSAGDAVLVLLFWSVLGLLAVSGVLVVAATLLRIVHLRQARREDAWHATWTPLLLEVLAADAAPETLWRRVAPQPGRQGAAFLAFLQDYAFTVRGEASTIVETLARPYLPATVRRARHRDPLERVRAVQALGLLGGDTYTSTLVAALDDPSPLVAMTAARHLARGGDAASAEAIVARLHRFEHWGTNQLVSLLSVLGRQAAPALRAVYTSPAHSVAARTVAGDALRWLNEPRAADAAAAVLLAEPDRELAAVSLRVLRRLGRPEHAAIIRPFVTVADPVVRIHAVSALAALGGLADAAQLRAAFDDASHWVAIRAARGLHEAGHFDALRELAESDHVRALLARQMLYEEG